MCLPKRENAQESPPMFIQENVRKTKERSANFENKGLGVVYAGGRY